ncbi:hypothetical protein P154DRAFT_531107 [Amniculicola lignicola CBS 123094]|uniref:Uncharacterized protein n=1 Tax=Amniculicola lignicola CBS 123094 TaxID=1392246 RepID=A0A6A5WTE1_9PLEO|nr:hypothetical protein P154DRAFT_531107 [Amniculicola lignicola CBS 123094]
MDNQQDLAAHMTDSFKKLDGQFRDQLQRLSMNLGPLFDSAPPLFKPGGGPSGEIGRDFVRAGLPPVAQDPATDELDNAIHPLFARNNFSGIQDFQYNMLAKCVLRLASKLITEPALLHWWNRLLFGIVKRHHPKAPVYLEDSQDYEKGPENIQAVHNHFLQLAQEVTVTFEKGPSNVPLENVINSTAIPCRALFDHYHHGHDVLPHPQLFRYHFPQIVLHYEDHLERLQLEFTQPKPWDYKQAGNVENISFHIVKALLHQVAHVFFMSRLHGDGYPVTLPEPLHSPTDEVFPAQNPYEAPKPDLGYSWEQNVFGTRSMLVFREWFFIGYHPWDGTRTDGQLLRVSHEITLLPNWWVHMWFRKAVWDNFERLWGTDDMALPKDEETGGRLSMVISGNKGANLVVELRKGGEKLSEWCAAIDGSFWGVGGTV